MEWLDMAKVAVGGALAMGAFVLKDYWAQRTKPRESPTLAECQRQHEEHSRFHAEGMAEKKAMRKAMVQVLLMMHPICDELLTHGTKYKDMDCDALHRCISDLTE
jgi:hypothetical protein